MKFTTRILFFPFFIFHTKITPIAAIKINVFITHQPKKPKPPLLLYKFQMQNREWRDCFSIVEIIPRGSIYNENPFSCVNALSHSLPNFAKRYFTHCFTEFMQKFVILFRREKRRKNKIPGRQKKSQNWIFSLEVSCNNWFIINSELKRTISIKLARFI